MNKEYKEYFIPHNIAEQCLASTTNAYNIFMDYLKALSNNDSLRYDRDFYLHYYARIKNALNDNPVGEELN